MYISSIQINSYKSYHQSSTLRLEPGFNVVTGQNNAGKTALLDALSLNIPDNRHRSLQTISKPGDTTNTGSTINATVVVDRDELFRIYQSSNVRLRFVKPQSPTWINLPGYIGMLDGSVHAMQSFASALLAQPQLSFKFTDNHNHDQIIRIPSIGSYVSDKPGRDGKYDFVEFSVDENQNLQYQSIERHDAGAEFGVAAVSRLRSHIYTFKAERFNLATCNVGTGRVLEPSARNLAEVLMNLQSNISRFKRYNEAVQRVLPQIKQVTVRNISGNGLEILVWSISPDTEREDLAVSLNESGTGVGQVLAILYVVLNSDHPRIILIDEPQSFLHPGAVRKLIEVLKEYPQHQYILTTHSPTVITAANPATITLIKQKDGVSNFEPINPTKNEELRNYLIEIGARLSDAFGADDILWVEGPTEEICFPMILEKVAQKPLLGTAIMAVKHTGDLEGRHAKTVFEIYDRLSKGQGLLPPAVGFIFDQEGRSPKEQEDIRSKSNNLVAFTPRRLYESYLLNPKAIAAVANGIPGFRDTPLTEAEVKTWIVQEVAAWIAGERPRAKYGSPPAPGSDWLTCIHGANLLNALFNQLSETRVSYDKISHSVALTKWLIENAPEDLREQADLIANSIQGSASRQVTTRP